jgi:hypothetical protein
MLAFKLKRHCARITANTRRAVQTKPAFFPVVTACRLPEYRKPSLGYHGELANVGDTAK